ncbi:hypothetical protein AKJ50_01025 [candidate division MSBL1 archaeon SCGC-AAA382A13]|uniref:Major facilitator superfamily (MFS) profile domain-containing protein n=1 Tax=candidate division MSBL1 archaeon SCGC-AAA382A13 TaxID=1698279 RepID=A0A133VG39_9EURY|nr:hypothetical protein AKJ50_01025 [candidate division MSBL1 archaeon SCGC-AAA382A13]
MRKILAATLFMSIAVGISNLVLPLFTEELGATYTGIGMLGLSYVVFYSLTSVPVGKLSDKYGRKILLLLGSSGMVFVYFLYTFADSVTHVLIIRLLHGAAGAPVWVLCETTIADLSSSNKSGRAMGLFGSSWATGFAIGPLIGGFLYSAIGARNSFIVCSILLIISSVFVVLAKFPEPKTSTKKINFGILWAPCLISFVFAGVEGIVTILFPPYARSLGIIEVGIGGLLTVFAMTRAISYAPFGHLVDKFGRRNFVITGSIAGFFTLVALSAFTNPFLLGLILIALALSGCAIYPSTASSISEIGAGGNRGFAFGVFNAIWMGGYGLWPSIGGKVADIFSPTAPYILAAILVLTTIPIAVIFFRDEKYCFSE